MKTQRTLLLAALVATLAFTSCVTPSQVNYLQDMRHGSQIELENKFQAIICPYDELDIYVFGPVDDEKVTKPFNIGSNAINGYTTNRRGAYLVDVNGDIQFPVLGQIHVAGLTRLQLQDTIQKRNSEVEDHKAMIKKYEKQQDNVRNNREFEAINKEIEFQNLEIQLCERRNRDSKNKINDLEHHIEAAELLIKNRQADLESKQEELNSIIQDTQKEEAEYLEKSKEQEQFIDERYLTAYKRIRKQARNGLAVVTFDREACGGCFSKIPPQRQSEIKMHKKVIVCEHCGRILVDDDIAQKAHELIKK